MQTQSTRIDVPEELKSLIPGFLERRDLDVRELKSMIKNEDFDGISLMGHRLKGQGGGYGLYALTDLGAELEKAAKDSSLQEARMAVESLESELLRIRKHLNLL